LALANKALIVGKHKQFLADLLDHLSLGDAQQESCCQNDPCGDNALLNKITNVRMAIICFEESRVLTTQPVSSASYLKVN